MGAWCVLIDYDSQHPWPYGWMGFLAFQVLTAVNCPRAPVLETYESASV